MVTKKQVVEITETFIEPGQDMKGLLTKLFFEGGVTTQEGTFNSINICSNNIKISEDIAYETMAFGNGKSIYCIRANTEEKEFQEHLAAINFFKDKYLNS
ncbi:MAG: hypothetical protein AABW67_02020 [Nanoarchaeota archaeon]